MKAKYYLFLVFISFTACTLNIEPSETVEKYYQALNLSDFNALSAQLGDSLQVIEGSSIANYSKNGYYQWFQWDSVFKPHYNILASRMQNDSLFITLSKNCKRIDFLHDMPLIYTIHPSIENGKITRIQTLSYQNADWNKWISRRDTLIASTTREHPELNPFIYDQTKAGAQTYLEAIELWLKGDKF